MRRLFVSLLCLGAGAMPVVAGEVLPPTSQRFVDAQGTETPSFQRHVIPLLGRLGCNGRACHGSFQGQGGFRLSLFGYDFDADHQALVGGAPPRVNVKNPAASLMLRKATRAEPHKGGRLIEAGTWEYHVLRRWIQAGGQGVNEADADFVTLEVEPREIVFAQPGQTRQLQVTAVWSDGTREDVTPLCRFRSNDEAVALIDDNGLVKAVGKGDTAVVAFYDNGIVPVQVLLPVTDRTGPRYPNVPAPTPIDELVIAKLRKLGIVPSDVCGDADFLRRVRLDLTGTLPSAAEVEAFLADSTPDKRAKKVDELLETPAYAAWWTTKLCDWTGNSEANGPVGGEQGLRRHQARQWYEWIHRRVRDNKPYDAIVEGLVLAVSRRPEQSYEDYCAEMSSYFRKQNPADFTARETMPYFWTQRRLGADGEKALAFSYSFLGVSLQCAQCHKHPYDQWTKQDFDQFTLFFTGVRYGQSVGYRTVGKTMKAAVDLTGDEDSGAYKRKFVQFVEAGHVLPFKELNVPNPQKARRPAQARMVAGRVITPKLLGGEEVVNQDYSDPRLPLMDWMRQPENPYFARAFVNRVWGSYFHVGLIDPPDDLNLANPPSNPALLDYLAAGFTQSGYDMKWLHRAITNSHTYQRSWRPNDTNRHDERNFSRAVPRRLPAEVAVDAINLATAADAARKALDADPVNTRAIGVVSCFTGGRDVNNYATNLFGKPPRTINCDCERSDEPSLLQTVYLRNDQEVLRQLDRKDGWLQQAVAARLTPEELTRQAYLRTLSRSPDPREAAIARRHLEEAHDLTSGLRDLMWALLNTKEFIVNR
ncbi:MAG: DUF1549 domain-containing protein [Gemmataceae bacterium]